MKKIWLFVYLCFVILLFIILFSLSINYSLEKEVYSLKEKLKEHTFPPLKTEETPYQLQLVVLNKNNLNVKSFILPLKQSKYLRITSSFGIRQDPFIEYSYFLDIKTHNAIDITSYYNAEIIASEYGKVINHYPPPESYDDYKGHPFFGGYLEILYDDYLFCYAHLSETYVRENNKVHKNMIIGRMGNTGISTGQHLHLEIYKIKDINGDVKNDFNLREVVSPLEYISNISYFNEKGYITLNKNEKETFNDF